MTTSVSKSNVFYRICLALPTPGGHLTTLAVSPLWSRKESIGRRNNMQLLAAR